MKYTVNPTSKFRKDYKLAAKRGQNLVLLDDIIGKLANGIPLESANRDQELSGEYPGHRECHITPGWLLIYFIENDVLVLSLTRTGTHSDLF
jgi:mRNA interferase YafQ